MKNIFNYISYKDYTFILIVCIAIFFSASYFIADNARETNEAKISMMEQLFKDKELELNNKINKRSDIEILEFNAKEKAFFAKENLEDISYHKAEIDKLQDNYEFNLLTQRCFESQIDRKINGLEYNVKYCELSENLDQFKTKK